MRTGSASLAILLGTLLGAQLLADDVHLKNGRSFENVVAEVGDAQVRVHMPGGVISLPRSAVDRVDKSDSSFAEYLRRKQELTGRERAGNARKAPASPASAWLELGRWARGKHLPPGAREAARVRPGGRDLGQLRGACRARPGAAGDAGGSGGGGAGRGGGGAGCGAGRDAAGPAGARAGGGAWLLQMQ